MEVYSLYKYFVIGGIVLGIFAWYFRFLKESENFEDKISEKVSKIKSILKRVDREEERKTSVKKVRFLANKTADEWSIFTFADELFSSAHKKWLELTSELFRVFFKPFIYRIERLF